MSRRVSRSNTNQLNLESNNYNMNNVTTTATNISLNNNNNNNDNDNNNETTTSYEEQNNIIPYEKIMKQSVTKKNEANKNKSTNTAPDYIIWSSLSNRLTYFRDWLDDTGCKLHSHVCVVNGEATDGTKNAPVILYGPPPPPSLIDSSNAIVNCVTGVSNPNASNTSSTSSSSVGAGEGRCGIIDSEIDRYLWEKTLGCQVRAARELKLNDTLCTIPRHAMITADVVACSDAGRAIYECMDHHFNDNNKSNNKINYWDDFVDVSQAIKKQLEKVNASNGTQLLVTILRERKKAESVGTSPKYKSLEHVKQIRSGVLSSRAPLLAFLIHQRFANHRCPPVVSNSEKNSFVLDSGMRYPPNSPKTFAPYIRTFPSSLSLPIGWKRNELALLAGCITGMTVLHEVAAHTLLLSSDFCALMESGIVLRYPHIFQPDMFTWDRWIWAASCLMSRNYPFSCYLFADNDDDNDDDNDNGINNSLKINNNQKEEFILPSLNEQMHDILKLQSPNEVLDDLGLLIPFMDMLNHERDNKCVLWKNPIYTTASEREEQDYDNINDNDDQKQITILQNPKAMCSKRIKKGNQVYSDYGTKCNQYLIIQYGFAQIHNKFDDVGIGWGLMDSVGVLISDMDAKQLKIKESIKSLVPSNEGIFLESISDNNNSTNNTTTPKKRWFITESQDTKSKNVPFWWNDDRFYVLEKEASVKSELVGGLRKGQRISGTAHLTEEKEIKEENEDGVVIKRTEKKFFYDPIFLSIATVATASPKQISDYRKTESLKINYGHQRRLRQFLISYFSTKLEKLLTNLDVGLCKAHYSNVSLWSKAKHGGINYAPDDDNNDGSSEKHMGWSTFFDSNVYSTSIEIEKKSSYYAISPDSCVLALYNGHLSALQCSLDGLLEKEVFDNNVVRQLSEMKFDVVDEEEEEEEVKVVEEKEEVTLPIGLQIEENVVVKNEDTSTTNNTSSKQQTNHSSTSGATETTTGTSTNANTANSTSSSSRNSRKNRKNSSDSTATNTNSILNSAKVTTQSSQGKITTISNKSSALINANNPDRPPAIKLHIGNLSYSTTPTELYDFFSRMYGQDNVLECHIPIERDSGKSRGFGFVTMPFLVARKALSQPSKHHEIDKRIVKIAESNTVGSSGGGSGSGKKRRGGSGGGGERERDRGGGSGPPIDGPSSNPSFGAGGAYGPSDRCLKCGYRPRYCFCAMPKLPSQQSYAANGSSGNGPPPPPPLRGHPQSLRHHMPPIPPHHMQHPHPPHHHHMHPNDIGMMERGGPPHPNDPHYHRSNRPYDQQAPPNRPYDPQAPPLPPRHRPSRSPLPHPSRSSRQSPPSSRMLQQQPPHHHPPHHPPSHHRGYHDDYHPGYHDDYPPNYHEDYPSSRRRSRDRERSRDRHRPSRSYSSASSSTTSSTSSSSSSSSDTSSTSDNSSNNRRHKRKRRRPRGRSSSSRRRHDQYHSSSRRSSSNRKESSSSRRRKPSSTSHTQSLLGNAAASATGATTSLSKRSNGKLADASTSSSSSSSRSNYKRHSKKKTRNSSSSRSNRPSNNNNSSNNAASSNTGVNDRKSDDGKNKHLSSSYNNNGP